MLDTLLIKGAGHRRLLGALLLAVALMVPFIAPNKYVLYVMALAFVMAISATGLNLITGYCGQFNLAHSGFMAIGAYTVGILTVDYAWPFWAAFALSGVMAALLGFVGGLLSLRLKGHYFSIFTMCVGFIIYLVLEKADGLTHGTVGIMGIPAPPTIAGIAFDTPSAQYYMALGFMLIMLFFMSRIVSSPLGHAFVAVRNSEDLAEALGVNLMRTKIVAFVISTFYAGVAGGLYAALVRFIGPALAMDVVTFELTMYLLIGGIGTLLGPVFGALILTWISQSLQGLQDYHMIVFGPLLILLVMFFPEGAAGWVRKRLYQLTTGRRAHQPSGASTEVSSGVSGGQPSGASAKVSGGASGGPTRA